MAYCSPYAHQDPSEMEQSSEPRTHGGFETGFYIFIVGIVVFALSLVLNNSLARTTAIRRAEVSVLTSQPTG